MLEGGLANLPVENSEAKADGIARRNRRPIADELADYALPIRHTLPGSHCKIFIGD